MRLMCKGGGDEVVQFFVHSFSYVGACRQQIAGIEELV